MQPTPSWQAARGDSEAGERATPKPRDCQAGAAGGAAAAVLEDNRTGRGNHAMWFTLSLSQKDRFGILSRAASKVNRVQGINHARKGRETTLILPQLGWSHPVIFEEMKGCTAIERRDRLLSAGCLCRTLRDQLEDLKDLEEERTRVQILVPNETSIAQTPERMSEQVHALL